MLNRISELNCFINGTKTLFERDSNKKRMDSLMPSLFVSCLKETVWNFRKAWHCYFYVKFINEKDWFITLPFEEDIDVDAVVGWNVLVKVVTISKYN